MPNVDRRKFIKLVGAGGVGVGAGFMLAETIKHPVEHLIPYPVPPEEYSPGLATWYNSVCNMCPAGCGITVRTREGRAKKIEGNPSHPVNQGKLCALGQAGLQVLYNPDRLTGPLARLEGEAFKQATWDEGLANVAERVAASIAANRGDDAVVFLSQGVRGHLAQLFESFMGALGSGQLLHYDFTHPHSLYAANRKLFGEDRLPYYDIANTRYLLSFGADYLTSWLSPVHNALGFGRSRQESDKRGRFVQIEPKMSVSGAAADEWVPAKPGTEGILALGIAHQLVAAGAYAGADADDWQAALAAYSAKAVAEQTGVTAETLTRIAQEFAHADPGLAIGSAGNHPNGVDTLVAVNALNYLVGNIGKPGGVVFNPEPARSAPNRQADFETLQALAARAKAGKVEVLIVNNTNPVFTLPAAAGFREALESIPFVVSLSSFMDETTAMADIVLPSHTYLESWGDDMPEPGVGFMIGAISQPVVSPLYNTRGTGDIVLQLAAKLGLREMLPWDSMENYIRDGWRQIYARGATDGSGFDAFWREVLMAGVWGEDTHRDHRDFDVVIDKALIDGIGVAAPEHAGNDGDHPFVLHPYLTTAMNDGRGANLPWMQELPEPINKVVYGSWVEMNPATAEKMGLEDGDIVRIESQHGSVEAPIVIFPAIRPDVVAMPIGQGHTTLGRWANDRGANVLAILAPETDASGGPATGVTRVSIEATGERRPAVKTGGAARQLGRKIVQTTGDQAHGDAHGEHGAKLHSIPVVVQPS